MSRFVQQSGTRGSQRWLQHFVNHDPLVLDAAIGVGPIKWLSPLSSDDFAEYRDKAFLDRLGITLHRRPLDSFWPSRGPQWDALGRADSGECVLVEAKAHVAEVFSPKTRASEECILSRSPWKSSETTHDPSLRHWPQPPSHALHGSSLSRLRLTISVSAPPTLAPRRTA